MVNDLKFRIVIFYHDHGCLIYSIMEHCYTYIEVDI